MKFTLGKDKKLKSKKAIDQLFTDGKSIRKGGLRLKYFPVDKPGENRSSFSVPKRFFKRAVDRNRIKRLLRESYRLQQYEIIKSIESHYNFMWIYQSGKMPAQENIAHLTAHVVKEFNRLTAQKDS